MKTHRDEDASIFHSARQGPAPIPLTPKTSAINEERLESAEREVSTGTWGKDFCGRSQTSMIVLHAGDEVSVVRACYFGGHIEENREHCKFRKISIVTLVRARCKNNAHNGDQHAPKHLHTTKPFQRRHSWCRTNYPRSSKNFGALKLKTFAISRARREVVEEDDQSEVIVLFRVISELVGVNPSEQKL